MLALSGGVGGAKLALGLSKLVASDRLVVIANTGDDFEHLGLYIFAGHRHIALYTRRPQQPGNRLGTPRGDLDLHGGP